jgi:type IV pilus assembly protein PilW
MNGMSLIELMIAMTIGLVVLLGLLQIFSSARAAAMLTEGMARAQESSRFAVDSIERDVRMAGHAGCISQQGLSLSSASAFSTTFGASPPSLLDFKVPLQAYEAVGTSPGNAAFVLPSETTSVTGLWSPQLPPQIDAATPDRVAGSDIVVLHLITAEGAPLRTVTGTSWPSLVIDMDDAKLHGFDKAGSSLYAVSDCQSATVFQGAPTANDASMTIIVGPSSSNTAPFQHLYTPDAATVYRAESIVYYVGKGSFSGAPTLVRLRHGGTTRPGVVMDREELVEGIDNLQVLIGSDHASDARKPSGYIDQIATAADAGSEPQRWASVGKLQIGVLAVSPKRAWAKQSAAGSLYSQGALLTPPNDGRYRSIYQTTIAIRNRLGGQ